jgi:hypothetical protein
MLGAVFFVVIILTGLNLMFYTFTQNAQLGFSIAEMEIRSQDKLAEKLEVLTVRMSSCTGTNCGLNVTVFNAGGRPIRIIRMWILNESYTTGWQHKSFETNYMVETSTIQTKIGLDLGIFNSSSKYSMSLVSDRGNIFSVRYVPNTSNLEIAMGSGWLTMDWSYYNYTYSTGKNDPDHGPYTAWCVVSVTSSKTYLFMTRVINHWDRDVQILKHSYLVLYRNNGAADSFYIMDPSATAQGSLKGQGAYSPPPYVVVPANPADPEAGGPLVPLKFLASQPGDTSQSSLGVGSYAAFVILFYQDIAGNTLAQTIPFEATEATSASSC